MLINSSLSHSDNCKNNFLVLGKDTTCEVNGNFGSPEKKFSINFSKTKTKFCLSLHYNADNSCLFVNRKKSLNLKPTVKMLIF